QRYWNRNPLTHGSRMNAFTSPSLIDHLSSPELLPAPADQLPLMDKVRLAVAAIKAQILSGRHCTVAWSSGKDSSVMLAITLLALRELINEGAKVPTLHILNANTLMENPAI